MTEQTYKVCLAPNELGSVLDALDYQAEDYAYRADYESRLADPDNDERDEFQDVADKISALATSLRERAGIKP